MLQSESAKRRALRAWRTRVLGVFACTANLSCLGAWLTSQKGVLVVLQKMACL